MNTKRSETFKISDKIFERFKEVDNRILTRTCSNQKLKLPEKIHQKFQIITGARGSEILFSFDNKVDYYKFSWNGTVESVELRLDESPILHSADPPEFQEEQYGCPYKIVHDDVDYFIILIRDTILERAYVYLINRETFDVTYQFYPYYFNWCNYYGNRQ